MPSKIVRRIERGAGAAGLFDALRTLSPTDLQSLLIELFDARSAPATDEPGLLNHARRSALAASSEVSAMLFNQFDRIAFESAVNFEAVDLSPVGPVGASFQLGGTSQNNVLTTIRNMELLGDSTVALALEAARRRKRKPTIRLCASHRVIRLQPFDTPGFSPHFRLFGMLSAGRDTGNWNFEAAELREHISAYLRCFRNLNDAGFSLTEPLVEIADMNAIEAAVTAAGVTRDEIRGSIRAHWPGATEKFLEERGIVLASESVPRFLETAVFAPLREEFPEAEIRINLARLEGLGYYRNFALRISPRAPDGNRYPITDGGFTDWTAWLLSNAKERTLISGIGTEFLCKKYRAQSVAG